MNTQIAACIFIALSAFNICLDFLAIDSQAQPHVEVIEGAR